MVTHQQALDWAIASLTKFATDPRLMLTRAEAERTAQMMSVLTGKGWSVRSRSGLAQRYWIVRPVKEQQEAKEDKLLAALNSHAGGTI